MTGIPLSDPLLFERLGLRPFDGPFVTEHSALAFAAVFRSVSIIASNIAGLDSGSYRTDDKGVKLRVPTFLDDPFRPRPDLPPILTKFEWIELMTVWLLLHGNWIGERLYGPSGKLVAINPIHPRSFSVEWDYSYAGNKKYTVTDMNGRTHVGGAERFLHIMGLSLDGLTGISVISAAALGVSIGLAGDKSAYHMFDRGATVSGLVTPNEGEDLSEKDVEFVKRMVRDTMTGVDNTGDIAVVNRRLNFTQWSMSAQDAQFLESRTFQIDEIGRWFGIPSHLLNLSQKSTSWGPGIAQQNIGLARYTLSPWTDRIASRLSIVVPRGQAFEFNYDRFLRPEPEVHITSILAQISGGLITPNEGRQQLNMVPIDGGDELRGGTANVPEPEPAEDNDSDSENGDIPNGDNSDESEA